jgi:peptidoglycan hydrolase-like protein with peptidoglycan-binding domain
LSVFAAIVFCGTVVVPVSEAKRSTGSHLGDRALRAGASGKDVRQLQKVLGKAGFPVKPDGRFGSSTVSAVKSFQSAAQLTASGVVGRKTVTALRRAARAARTSGGVDAASVSAKPRTSLGSRVPVRRGMRGHDIRVLQDLLGNAGLDVTIDGEFGSGTFEAVKAFEQRAGRAVDGVVDAADIEALRAAAAAGPPPPATPATTPVALSSAPGDQATLAPDGTAVAPANAPEPVKQIIAAGNAIATKPYKYGGGHGNWDDSGYDCSGSVSYALHGAGLLEDALPSGSFVNWGDAGPGQWVTIYAHGGHMYMVVAGLRFDTSGRSKAGTRWQTDQRSPSGYTVRHPPGL